MVFQGFSFFAMALVSVGVIAYHFYKHREALFYNAAQNRDLYSFPCELSYYDGEEENSVRKRKVDICSICMESVQSLEGPIAVELASSAVCLPCKHLFHTKCVTTWLDTNKTCPNCRAPAPAAM